ncbi:hypothetical protein GCM10007939_20890 [Amylibacter marinus]|uniref:Lasso RiPP family leader peptide-containing protein n=1 Tax=Amylibacter marinus TaxID=1475483 RepID=A0ABQ5VWJ0_9RHOB|nr:hypothetical protein [Amylibacter marinus]GLQ35806.1 hypothetical protein GCM10007939_20890 [Amylibacter marinus]
MQSTKKTEDHKKAWAAPNLYEEQHQRSAKIGDVTESGTEPGVGSEGMIYSLS